MLGESTVDNTILPLGLGAKQPGLSPSSLPLWELLNKHVQKEPEWLQSSE